MSSAFKTDNNKIRFPLGHSVMGFLSYDVSGHMAAQLYGTGRAAFAHDDLFNGSDQEVRQVFVTLLYYFGCYKIDYSKKGGQIC
ncbi:MULTISPECIES: lipocalin-like domain-containing protein [Serratia]|uniref:lipocalin-like domain-containing protein n=1 Tax=Serratia TaxID=613 RepID=UPI001F4BF0CE|nr:lipocalin-like domain-containing protein [Serratia entomophila]CAI1946726.1 Uncharacterised protein [Serratia quinivorans]CAI2160055.1 Uncharacterised protein [Serratia quinivorans]